MVPARRFLWVALFVGAAGLGGGEDLSRFQVSVGPRVGAEYYAQSVDAFSELAQRAAGLPVGSFTPFISTFAIAVEQRIPLGSSGGALVVREVIDLGGMEQSVLLPSGRLSLGFRHRAGWEVGLGPVVGRLSLGVVMEAGYRFDLDGAGVPVTASVILPNRVAPMRIGISAGFDFALLGGRASS